MKIKLYNDKTATTAPPRESAKESESMNAKRKKTHSESGRYCTCSILFDFFKLNVNSAAANKQQQQKNAEKTPNIFMFRLFN